MRELHLRVQRSHAAGRAHSRPSLLQMRPTPEVNSSTTPTNQFTPTGKELIMRARWAALAVLLASCLVLVGMADNRHRARDNARHLVRQGQQVFRFDTFGDEAFWGGVLGLHKAI